MNPCELTASVTAIANMPAGKLTVDELNLLGAVLTLIGDTLTTIAAQKTLCESHESRQQNNQAVPDSGTAWFQLKSLIK